MLHKLFTSFACPTHISSFTTINYSFTDIQESYQGQIWLDKWNKKSKDITNGWEITENNKYGVSVETWEGMIMMKSVKVIIKHEYIQI